MKIRILSDLHLEFGSFTPSHIDCDVVVLAGDIHLKTNGVEWAKTHFSQPVLYVPGNHEYYGGSLTHTLNKLRKAAEGTNVHVLDRNVFELNGVRFLGATLWTDYRLTGNQPLAEIDAMAILSDFKKIRNKQYSKIKPMDILKEHSAARIFLMNELAIPFEGKTVVVSHHAPSSLSLAERYVQQTKDHLSAAYASELSHLMGESIDLWIHGHTHDSFSYEIAETRVVCNPRGYAPQHLNPNFNDELVLTL